MILAQGAVDAAPEKPRIVVVGDDDRNENPVGCRMSHGTPRAAFMGMDTAPHRRTQETGASARCSPRAPLSSPRPQRKKRSEEPSVGKESVSTCSSMGSPFHYKKKTKHP